MKSLMSPFLSNLSKGISHITWIQNKPFSLLVVQISSWMIGGNIEGPDSCCFSRESKSVYEMEMAIKGDRDGFGVEIGMVVSMELRIWMMAGKNHLFSVVGE